MNSRTFNALAAVVLIVGLAGPAAGSERDTDAQRRIVRTEDLDVTKLADVEALYARIRTAALSACRAQQAIWNVKRQLHKQRCVERVVEETIVNADEPLLTAVHRRAGERVAER